MHTLVVSLGCIGNRETADLSTPVEMTICVGYFRDNAAKSRFPAGMTERKAKAKADSLRYGFRLVPDNFPTQAKTR
jgi:hypothetical protein